MTMAKQSWRLLAAALALLGFVTMAWAETEVDPGAVSDGLKAIFKYGPGTHETADRLNSNTVTIMTGTIAGTYVQFGADLASALDNGDQLRVLPIIGRGSVQGVADILFLKGVDLGIVRSDTLDYLEKRGYANNIKKQFTFITKLYNEEMHVLAPKSIRTLADLEQRLAYEKLKKGEIDAMISVQGKPSKFNSGVKDENLHFVPVDYAKSLQPDFLAAYNWSPNTERYRRLARFVDVFFNKIAALQQPPFHPKWKEVALNAPLSGWSRFRPAQEWLDRNSSTMASADARRKFDQFLGDNQVRASAPAKPEDREALFRQFLEWQKNQPVAR